MTRVGSQRHKKKKKKKKGYILKRNVLPGSFLSEIFVCAMAICSRQVKEMVLCLLLWDQICSTFRKLLLK
jgi:hypothetical protein